MADELRDLRGTRLENLDLTDSRIHGAFLVRTKVTDAWVHDVDLSGEIRSLVVNGVEVAGYVRSELERRHPELLLLDARDAAGLQRACDALRRIADATLATARRLPSELLDASVDGEYSYLQTLRHLLFATDRWITGPVLGRAEPFHRLGVAYDGAPAAELAALDLDATPSLDEVLAARAERAGFMDDVLRDATDPSLARIVDSPNGGTTTVGDCIRVVLKEEWWHHRYADRDLALLARGSGAAR